MVFHLAVVKLFAVLPSFVASFSGLRLGAVCLCHPTRRQQPPYGVVTTSIATAVCEVNEALRWSIELFPSMSTVQQRKAEILAKRAKLAELKKQRELRQKEFSQNRASVGDASEV